MALLTTFFSKTALKFQHFNKAPHNLHFLRGTRATKTPLAGRVFETPALDDSRVAANLGGNARNLRPKVK